MPNRKAKANAAPRGKEPTVAGQAASPIASQPSGTSNVPHAPPSKGPSASSTEDFWTKNARAKALIMSTLVPGSEPWKIAEPLELASDIWRALEEKYAPKEPKSKLDAGGIIDAAKKGEPGSSQTAKPSSSDFIGDWVEGKPMDKYLDMYKDRRAAQSAAEARSSVRAAQEVKPPPSEVKGAATSVLAQQVSTEQAQPVSADQETVDDSTQPGASASWHDTTIIHDSYLTENQALSFAQNDPERKRQIQAATTKVLMQKLPTRDLRFLWAILYGGENAPWPGSKSAIIPGVTVPRGHSTFRLNPG